jgi:molybdopterin molybdotransferase
MAKLQLSDILGCLADYDPGSVPVSQAQAIIERFVEPVHAIEKVALRAALDRVLAGDILSPINVPAHDNSAMDGFALRFDEIQSGRSFAICGTAYAGRAWTGAVAPGQCVRIMTGGVMPAGCDTVIPQEFTQAVPVAEVGNPVASADANKSNVAPDGGHVFIPAGLVRAGDNRRLCGEDLQQGKPALFAGKILRPADLGLLASLGIAEVPVQRRLRVAFFSTGDELRSIGELLDAGCVYDSNRYTLYGMLTRLGCELLDMGIIPDQPEALEAALRTACENADAIITSGGVSVGAADYTKQIMAKLGEVAFWTIAMRPGRPMAFGRIQSNGRQAWLFGLPGNPVAVMVTFHFFARAALHHMMGAKVPALPLLRARSQQSLRKKPGRTEYQRGILSIAADGLPQVKITGAQGSGILRSMSEANCMIVLGHEQGNVAEGEEVAVLMFEGLL